VSLVAVTFLVLALARPQAEVALPRSEGTLILTFDVSGSMSAEDVGTTRLEAAKAAARTIVAERPDGVVIGVVAFSDGGISVQIPTADRVSLDEAISRLAPTLGTSVGEGILVSLDTIARLEQGTPAGYYSSLEPVTSPTLAPGEPGSHAAAAIVLLSDGENTVPPDPATTALTAAGHGVRVHTVAVGSPGGAELDLEGFMVHTTPNAAVLRYVADVTTGTAHVVESVPSPLPEGAVVGPVDSVDPAVIYASLSRQLTVDPEPVELTALVGGLGGLLLVSALVFSLIVSGRAA
jgi:Ca-activated chloride channel family protein